MPKAVSKDQVLLVVSILLLFYVALVNWTVQSWLVLAASILVVLAWYWKK